jgi:tetratricopeptide (TPR) repeat protein
MTYQEEEPARLRRQRSKQAIALAMQGRWKEAVAANKNLIESFPGDVDAYNRLGKAYIELGEGAQAREAYSRAVELDPYNIIARKNLHRLSHLTQSLAGSEGDSGKVEPQQFIEETGKAGVVSLHHLAPQEQLARVEAGDKVALKIDGTSLIVEDSHGEYLGKVGPRHGQRLIKLMEGGNRYTAAIISSAEDKMTVIIREVYQHPGQAGRVSFPAKGRGFHHPYVGERVFRRELEYEEARPEEPGYTIIGDEAEAVYQEPADDKTEEEEA